MIDIFVSAILNIAIVFNNIVLFIARGRVNALKEENTRLIKRIEEEDKRIEMERNQ